MNRVMVVLGIALLAAGLVVGFFIHVHAGGYDCGTAFRDGGKAFQADLRDAITGGSGVSGCDSARSSAKVLPIVLLVIGAVALVGSAFVTPPKREAPFA